MSYMYQTSTQSPLTIIGGEKKGWTQESIEARGVSVEEAKEK